MFIQRILMLLVLILGLLMKSRLTLCFIGVLLLVSHYEYGQAINGRATQQLPVRSTTEQLRICCQQIDSLRQKGNYDSLYTLIQHVLPIAVKAKATDYQGQLYHRLVQYYTKQNLLDRGIAVSQQALTCFRQTRDTTAYARSLYLLARLYAGKSDYERAINASLKVLSMAVKTKHSSLTTAAYSLLIAIYNDLHDYRSVTFYTNQYLHYATRTKNPADLFSVLLYKAESFERQSNYLAAWPFYAKALKLANTMMPSNRQAQIYNTTEVLLAMENNLRHRHQYTEGEKLLRKAIRFNEQIRDIPSLVNVWNSIALNYQQQHLDTKSLQAATQALSYTKQVKATAGILLVLPTLVATQRANGLYRQALATQSVYMRLKDSLLTKEKNNKIAQLQASFEVERKDQLIQLLHKGAQLDQIKAKEQTQRLAISHQQQLILITGIGALVIILGIVFYFLRRSRAVQARLAQQTQQIEAQATQLQASNDFKDRLFSIISHDLRSPVASLRSSLLLEAGITPFNVDKLERDVTGLQYTLDNMLYWSLSQRNGLRVQWQSVDLADLMSEVIEGFDGLVRHKKIAIHFQPMIVHIKTDENLTLIVLRNLLHNAIKFTPEGGRIYLHIQPNKANVDLIIQDEGPGMPTHDYPEGIYLTEQGTGLGLLLSNELMSIQKGRVQIKSTLNQGTTVTLSWPSGLPLWPT